MSRHRNVRRLFLLAGYDRAGVVDDSLVMYARALSQYGDVVVHMDNDSTDDSIKRLAPYTIYAAAARHGEYDFGSYKRAYMYARDADILKNYDFVYMLNDSVYGPLYDLGPILENMESHDWDVFGLVYNPHRTHPHIQSWFIGMRPVAFLSNWFDKFITGVTHQSSKGLVTKLYEQGFTALARENGLRMGCVYTVKNRGVYNQVRKLYRRGMPFMKKVAFIRHNGSLGGQIKYVLSRIPAGTRDAILQNARRTYGDEYISQTLTSNPLRILARRVKYAWGKTRKGRL